MAIKFDVSQKGSQNNDKISLGLQTQKPKIISLSEAFIILAIISVIFSISYIGSPIIVLIGALFLFLLQIVIIVFASILSLGTVWFNDTWKSFNSDFFEFTKNFSDLSTKFGELIIKILPIISIIGLIIVICNLIILIKIKREFPEKTRKIQIKLVSSVILLILYIGFIIFDYYIYFSINLV